MATIRQFEDLEAWKKSRQLAKEIWLVTNQGTFARDYKLKDQINDSSGSAMDNIAEGFGRAGIQNLSISSALLKGPTMKPNHNYIEHWTENT